MAQTWNNVLRYVKLHMGTKLNLLEFSDEEMIENFKEVTLDYFSQFIPHKKSLVITRANLLPKLDSAQRWKYKIETEDPILDIYGAYPRSLSSSYGEYEDDPFYGTKYSTDNLIDNVSMYSYGGNNIPGGGIAQALIDTTYVDMAASITTKNTWEFIPPYTIIFDKPISICAIEYNTKHENLNTIQPDFYEIIFKPMCLLNLKEWVYALRSKYESLATPFGEIKTNWSQLGQEIQEEKNKLEEKLNQLPMDRFIEIS